MSGSSRDMAALIGCGRQDASEAGLLPKPGVRTIPAGLARGVKMPIDFAYQTRTYLGLYESS